MNVDPLSILSAIQELGAVIAGLRSALTESHQRNAELEQRIAQLEAAAVPEKN